MRSRVIFSVALLIMFVAGCGGGETGLVIGQITGPSSIDENTSTEYTVDASGDSGITYLWARTPTVANILINEKTRTVTINAGSVDADIDVTLSVRIISDNYGPIVQSFVVEVRDLGGTPVVVDFPDANLQSVIRERINKPTGDILTTDLTVLTELPADNMDISSLVGLQHCKNLNFLSLWHNQISDLSPIRDLTNLEWLYMERNLISDIGPLQEITSLRHLNLNSNQISDIGPLVNNSGIGSGDGLWIWSNPLSCTVINEQIPTLEARGVMVMYAPDPDCD